MGKVLTIVSIVFSILGIIGIFIFFWVSKKLKKEPINKPQIVLEFIFKNKEGTRIRDKSFTVELHGNMTQNKYNKLLIQLKNIEQEIYPKGVKSRLIQIGDKKVQIQNEQDFNNSINDMINKTRKVGKSIIITLGYELESV